MNQLEQIELADVFGVSEALAYVNERLPENRQLSRVGFKRHLFDPPDRPGTLFQLEPIALGERDYDDYTKATALVFTRRMLDEYVANREANRRRAVERAVTRPTEGERAALMGRGAARLWLNDWFAARRSPFRFSKAAMNSYVAGDRIPHRVIGGRTAVFLARDLEAFAHDYARRWRGLMRPSRGWSRRSGRPARRAPIR